MTNRRDRSITGLPMRRAGGAGLRMISGGERTGAWQAASSRNFNACKEFRKQWQTRVEHSLAV